MFVILKGYTERRISMFSTNKSANRLYTVLLKGCFNAVLLTLLFFLVTAIMVEFTPGMNFLSFIILLFFGIFIEFANLILTLEDLPPLARRLLHIIILAVGVFFVLLLTTKAFLVGFILYGILYGVIFGLSYLLRRFVFKKDTKKEGGKAEEPYRSRFS